MSIHFFFSQWYVFPVYQILGNLHQYFTCVILDHQHMKMYLHIYVYFYPGISDFFFRKFLFFFRIFHRNHMNSLDPRILLLLLTCKWGLIPLGSLFTKSTSRCSDIVFNYIVFKCLFYKPEKSLFHFFCWLRTGEGFHSAIFLYLSVSLGNGSEQQLWRIECGFDFLNIDPNQISSFNWSWQSQDTGKL